MKNCIWILLTALIFAYCANENSNSSATQDGAATNASEEAGTAEPGHYEASPDAPLVGLWAIQFALGSKEEDEKATASEYQGRWFHLKSNNTFDSGKWQEKNNTGKWNYDPEAKIIQLHFDNSEQIGVEWKIQGQGEEMVWLGNTPNNQRGIQMKLTRELKLPQPQ